MKRTNFLPTVFAASLALGLTLAGCSQAEAPATPNEPKNGEPEITMNSSTPATSDVADPAGTSVQAPSSGSEKGKTIKVVTLEVPGMSCQTCPDTVRSILVKMNGVKKADADGPSMTAIVDFDPAVISAEEIAARLGKADAHYKAKVKKVST